MKANKTKIGLVARSYKQTFQMISTFDKFESCELKSRDYGDEFDMRTVAESLEAVIPFGPLKTITHRYRIPESNEYLEFNKDR
ncbi:hypothetical protein B9Z55_026929 [Caenorhabditis nigoni]|uniref:Uncharacterized protein n=1 Tax=Caenorhabditis nigoni TaxID=1611254 RepID=A0A2G5SI77_9PELO|nr:hypothetical protein B9Z55_026929 [Caenorhabditis nigoni]